VTPPICRSSSDSVEIIPSLDSEHQGATDRKGIVAYQRLHERPKARITFGGIDCSGRPRYLGFEIDRGMSAPRAGRCHGAFPSTVANRDGARLRGTLVTRFSTGEAPLERRQMSAERLFNRRSCGRWLAVGFTPYQAKPYESRPQVRSPHRSIAVMELRS
jgi:hypothetical protein